MVRITPNLILVVIACVTMGSCGSCNCGEKDVETTRVFPTRRAGFAIRTPRRAERRHLSQRNLDIPTIEPTSPPVLPTAPPVVDLPTDFPEDVPVFEGSEAFAVQQLAGDARNVLFHVDAERPEIFRHYRESMQREGWDVTQEFQAREQSFLSFKKGKMIANMTISPDPRTGKRVVGIMYQEEKELPFDEF